MSDPAAALNAALARIAQTEAELQAWVEIDEPGARAQAAEIAAGAPLAGMIAGVKDIFDVAGMPTRRGMPAGTASADDDAVAERDAPAECDAVAVARLRAAGAVVLGKTQSTPYAWLDPAPTRNPHDPSRTPGGSSAGSAAAVAAGHCTVALGSQTAGSTIRPASFCGVVGFKPTFGRISTAGVMPLAPSLDHVGIFASSVAGAAAVARALDPSLALAPPSASESASGTSPAAVRAAPLRLRFIVSDLADDHAVEPTTRAAVERAAAALRAAGCDVGIAPLPDAVRRGGELLPTVAAYESVAAHGATWRALGDRLPPHLRALLAQGEATPRAAYEAALAERERLRPEITRIFADTDLLLMPCAPGEAPDRATTGDARYVRTWTFFGLPAIAVPVSGARLPVGVQLVAPLGADELLLAAAERLETALISA